MSDLGQKIFCRVIGSNVYGADTAYTNVVGPVTSLHAPYNAGGADAPDVTGTPTEGEELTCDPGDWSGDLPMDFDYQWYQEGVDEPPPDGEVLTDDLGDPLTDELGEEAYNVMVDTPIGTNSPNYTLVSGDVGATIFCRVRATNASGSADAFSNAVGPVEAGAGGGDTSAPAMTNLWTWLRADAGTFQDAAMTTPATAEGDIVNGWADQSGGTPSHFFAEAAGSPEGPFLRLTGGPNSKPYLHFDQSSVSRLFIGPSAAALTAGEVFIVIKTETDASGPPTTQNTIWSFDGVDGGALYPYGANGQIYDGWGRDTRPPTGVPALPLTSWRLYNVVSTSSEWTSFLDNVQHSTTATNTVSFSTAPQLGGWSLQGFPGWIAEYIMYSAKCSAPDKLQTVTYLSNKYALGIV